MMTRALFVAVRFHDGRYHGKNDWPPAPARVYQALVAGIAKGAKVSDTAWIAFKWLERLSPPIISAPREKPGQNYTNFVPNNDLDAALSKKQNASNIGKAVSSTRVGKTIRPILFNADMPILYCWFFEGSDAQATTLCEIAQHLYQLGRGVDMAWANAEILDSDTVEKRLFNHGGIIYHPSANGSSSCNLLCPCVGSAQSLANRFEKTRTRFQHSQSNNKPHQVFANPPKALFAKVVYQAPPRRFLFSLKTSGTSTGFAPQELCQAASLITDIRNQAAQQLYENAPELAEDVTRFLIGRGASDADKAARVRIIPLPSTGHSHADMMIRRIAIYVPQFCPMRVDDLSWAFAQVAWTDAEGEIIRELEPDNEEKMAQRYEGTARSWQSVTPLALSAAYRRGIDPKCIDKNTKGGAERAEEEVRAVHAVRQTLRHAGINTELANVRVQREPFDRQGERVEAFTHARFKKQTLWHVAIDFVEPVTGPLVLGDGRYLGLGLMRPIASNPTGILAFAIAAGLTENTDPTAVARAARRAMLARVQSGLPRGERIPCYVSGHEENGTPMRRGDHRHIAIIADLPRRRLLFIAPNMLQRSAVSWHQIKDNHVMVEQALEGMIDLRAGRAGRITLAPSALNTEDDPLFAPSRVWESLSDYSVIRHRRRSANEEALISDAFTELDRIGWPKPSAVEVLAVRSGPRNGLSGHLRFTFSAAQAGPLVIGRTLHKGGGLFVGSPPSD